MPHVNIDKVLYRLSGESGVRPSVDMASGTPGTSRTGWTEAKSPRPLKMVPKGLSRSAVTKQRVSKTEYHIRVKGSRAYVGLVRKQNVSKASYGYRKHGDFKETSGFPTQESAIRAMLTGV